MPHTDQTLDRPGTGPFSAGATASAFVLTSLSLVSIGFLVFFGIEALTTGLRGHGIMLLGFAAAALANYLVFLAFRRHGLFRNGVVALMAVVLLSLVLTGGVDNTGPLWFFILPPVAFYISGLRAGTVIVAATWVAAAVILFLPASPLRPVAYAGAFQARFLGSLLLVSIMSFILEYSRHRAHALLLEKMRLLDERRREIRERNRAMEADLRMARELQQAMLPRDYPRFPEQAEPERSAIRFYHRYQPAGTVGGDFFHLLRLSDASVGILLCDVMGHEVRAALVTAMLRALAESMIPLAPQPGRLMTRLNADVVHMLEHSPDVMFATGAYLVVDVDQRVARFTRAGHHEALRIRRRRGEVGLLRGTPSLAQPALGLISDAEYATEEVPLEPGDLILLFTDGLFELTDARGRELGFEGLQAIVQQQAHLPPSRLLDEVLAEVLRFSAARSFEDDVCVIGVEVCPDGGDEDEATGVAGQGPRVSLI